VELYLHSASTPSWCGAQLKEAQGQLYLLPLPWIYQNCTHKVHEIRYLVLVSMLWRNVDIFC
jgi:hypothetical protein